MLWPSCLDYCLYEFSGWDWFQIWFGFERLWNDLRMAVVGGAPKKRSFQLSCLWNSVVCLSYVQIGPGIQNFKKILPAYVRTRVYATPCYEQAYLAISLQQKEQCMRLNHSFQMGQRWLTMAQDDWLWPRMTYQGSGGHQGVQGGARGRQGAGGCSRRQKEW